MSFAGINFDFRAPFHGSGDVYEASGKCGLCERCTLSLLPLKAIASIVRGEKEGGGLGEDAA